MSSVRYVVRPNNIRHTPKRLVTLLNAQKTNKASGTIQLDWHQDLFLAYPDPQRIDNTDEAYDACRSFYVCDKLEQRALLRSCLLPIVPTYFQGEWIYNGDVPLEIISAKDVERPLRHARGQGFEVLQSDTPHKAGHYRSKLISKDKEYRLLYYKGQLVATYLKANPNSIPSDQPWNHANGTTFQTVYNPQNDLISRFRPELLETAASCPFIKHAHLCALDVLWEDAGQRAWVCELNYAPTVKIQNTLDRIKEIQESL